MSSSKDKSSKDPESTPVEASGEGFVMMMGSVERAIEKGRSSVVQLHEKSRSAAAPAVKKAKITLSLGASRSSQGLSSLYSGRLRPALSKSGKWLRKRLNPLSLRRDYSRGLLLAHRFGADRNIEKLMFVPTAKTVPLSQVRVPHQLRRTGHDYRPTPWHVFHWAMSMIPESFERFAFVDYGAGRGRVLLMASQYPFDKVTGAEIAAELHQDCILNIAQFSRSYMKCRDVMCEHLSALRLDIPDQETVFYFHNPFDHSMFERIVEQIVRSYRQDPRRFYIVCIDMKSDEVLEDAGIFEKLTAPLKTRLKQAAASPYAIRVYRTVH